MVRGRHTKTKIWDMTGKVADIVHGGRAVFVKFHSGGSRLFRREDVRKDTTKEHEYKEEEDEELEEMVKGSDMKVRKDEELKESQSSTRKTTDTTSNDEGPRRSRRIREKNKRVVIGGE